MKLRDYGLDSVEMNNLPWVHRIRAVAVVLSQRNGYVSADDLRLYAQKNDDEPDHPNAWGSIFRGKGWVPISRKKSSTPSAHARSITVWRWMP